MTKATQALAVVAVALLAINLRIVFGSSSAVASEIRDWYHLSASDAALLTTGPVICLGLFCLVAPRALRRWSAPTVLAACLAVIAVGTAIRGFDSWPILVAGTLIAGAGIAVANVLGPVFIRVFFPRQIGAMTGLFTALVCASSGVASGITVPLANGPINGWRPTLAAWAVPTLVAFGAFVALAIRHHRSTVTSVRTTAPRRRVMSPTLLRNPTAWALTGFMGLQSFLAYSVIGWLPSIYRDRGLSAESSGLILTILSIASIATALTVPVIAMRLRHQRLLAVGIVALSAVGLLGVLVSGTSFAVLWAIVLGFGQGGLLSLAISMINLRSRDATTTADLSTMVQTIGYLIAAGGPLAIGAVNGATHGWSAPILLLLALLIPMSVCGYFAGQGRVIDSQTAS